MSQALTAAPGAENPDAPLTGGMLWVAALMLASANFIAVLNMTIANVAVPNIGGALGAASSQATWVITSYAVGEAITVPLTGWLASRFGSVRVFTSSMMLFGVFSLLCGLSNSLGMLVVARVFQGLSGGPLMPLSQTLLMRIFPKDKVAAAIGLWSMTTLGAPVVGPILGGWLCDEYSWSWVFLINAPIAIGFGIYAWKLLKRYQEDARRSPIAPGIGVFGYPRHMKPRRWRQGQMGGIRDGSRQDSGGRSHDPRRRWRGSHPRGPARHPATRR